MSEYTSGNLILNRDIEYIAVFQPTYVKPLNEKWSVFFTQLTSESFQKPNEVTEAQSDVPVMYFSHAGDQGWSFRIIKSGQEISRFEQSYEQDTMDLIALVEKLQPDADAFEDLFINEDAEQFRSEMIEVLYAQKSKLDRVKETLTRFSLNAFAEFDLSAQQLAELDCLLRPEQLIQEDETLEIVERFQKILGIEEMSWVSAAYEAKRV
ncbi:hypothetical protein B9G55_04960 [Saccharibacillus sp. O16]|nr:hypothetical protein B9G55_04960 [Saccharibacillus sp. O16]